MSRFHPYFFFTLVSLALVACGDEDGNLKPGNTAYGKSISSGNDPNGSGASSGGDTSGSGSSGASGSGGSGSGASGSSGSGGNSPAPDAGAPASSGSGGNTGASSPEQICVDQINAYRKTVGSPPLARWNAEETCADGQAQSDSKSGSAHGAFGMCSEMGQNECPGWPGPAAEMIPSCLKAMWGEGPGGGHYENMKATRYTQVSCGFYTLADGSVWAVQNFR